MSLNLLDLKELFEKFISIEQKTENTNKQKHKDNDFLHIKTTEKVYL